MWKDVPGYEGRYRANAQGQIYSVRRKRVMKGYKDPDGYLKANGIDVHRMVLEAFVGPRPKGMECRHLNGNPSDNRLENLCWGTRSENQRDRWAHSWWYIRTFGEHPIR